MECYGVSLKRTVASSHQGTAPSQPRLLITLLRQCESNIKSDESALSTRQCPHSCRQPTHVRRPNRPASKRVACHHQQLRAPRCASFQPTPVCWNVAGHCITLSFVVPSCHVRKLTPHPLAWAYPADSATKRHDGPDLNSATTAAVK